MLRNANCTTIPPNRLSSFQNSFFPRTIRRWNSLHEEIRSIQSVRSFSQAVAQVHDLNKPPLFFSYGYKTENILHTRLRLGMSHLNAHLFKIHSSQTDTPNCNCAPVPETVQHFLLACPRYNSARTELELSLRSLISDYDKLNANKKLKTLLYGKNLNNKTGLAVAVAVQNYIKHTRRF